jgi:ComF family protein
MDNLLDLLFPPKCIFCGNYGSVVCPLCLDTSRRTRKFDSLPIPFSPTSLNKHPSLNVFSYFVYEKKIRDTIKRSKYSQKRFSALREVSKFALQDMLARHVTFPDSTVVPIPLSNKKQRRRGFNQAALIAEVFSKAYAMPLTNSLLLRQQDTSSQHRLDRQQRLQNLKGAFVSSPQVVGKSIILVDDICTTGATLIEAAGVLYHNGASDVTAFTLSRQPRIYGSTSIQSAQG